MDPLSLHPEALEDLRRSGLSDATIAEAAKVVSGRSTLTFENRYLCKDGSYKRLLWSAVVRLERGLIYCIAADVTERKQEEVRLAAQYAVTRVLADRFGDRLKEQVVIREPNDACALSAPLPSLASLPCVET